MFRRSIDRKIFWLLILLPCLVNFGCGKKNLPSESVVTQQRETKTGREIFLEKIKGRKEKSDLIKDEKKIVYPKWKKEVKVDKERGREALNNKIKEVTQKLNEIAQDDNLSEEEKNERKKELKRNLREFIIEGPCDVNGEEMESILKEVESEE